MSVVELVTDGPVLLAAPVAAAAGLLSFLSPCVLPLVPGYLSFVTGLSGEELADRPRPPAPDVATAGQPAVAGADAGAVGAAAPVASAAGIGGRRAAGPSATVTATVAVSTAASGSSAAAAPTSTPVSTAGSVSAATLAPAGVAGVAAGSRLRRVRRSGRITAGTILFVLGFTAVFVSSGAAFGGLGQSLTVHQVGVSQVLGAFTIVMGLTFAGVFSRMSWANREWRIHRLPAPGLLGAPVLGVLFGIGWTPCLGPTLAAVQGLAITSATAGRGAFLSAAYCLGLGIPFLVVGLAFRRAVGAIQVMRRHARTLALVGGVMLVAVGALQLTGEWADLVGNLRPYAPGFSETPL